MKEFAKIRIKTLFIDILIIGILWFILFAFFTYALSGCTNYNIGSVLFLGLFLCKDNLSGQSLGKRICKLKVIDDKGQNASIIKLIGRNLFLFVAPVELVLLMYYDIRLGDKMFGTQVIPVEKSDKITFKNLLFYLLSLVISVLVFLPFVGL